ncbi:nuclear transport factor 2 family protein [Olivibacter jilunii]|uniref:nuclear transport factor 2 family protein n=1 Tax=Olivibacter jilunii TaxID=985016 RepID=UPI003F159758
MANMIEYKEKYEREQANKALVLKAYQALFGDLDVSVLDKYWTADFKQHNPMAEDGTRGLRKTVEGMIAAGAPKTKLDIKRISAEDNLVWVHLKMDFMGKDHAIIDIFRVENGKLAEHWDVLQGVPEKAANNNSMF